VDGQYEDSVAFVRSANGGRTDSAALRIETEAGKVKKDVFESTALNKSWHVLEPAK
jgi:hypothetical protein